MYNWWQQNPVILVSWVFWVIISICLHELGHGVTAIRCGDDTPRVSGHMTLNPLVHIPGPAWITFLLTGLTWGLMPVNPSRFRRTIDDAYVAAAGPAVNLVLAIICLTIGGSWIAVGQRVAGAQAYHNFIEFLRVGAVINVIGVPLNLIPIPPLDGSRILAAFSWEYRKAISNPNATNMGLIAVTVLLVFSGKFLYPACFSFVDGSLAWLGRLFHAISV